MKSLLTVIALSLGLAFTANAAEAVKEEPKTKRVCKETKDSKGKSREVCKTIKIHKKHEGTVVPDKKK